MKKNTTLIGTILCFFLAACSTAQRGTVAMKVSPRKAHVSVGSKTVSPGTIVEFYESVCLAETVQPDVYERLCELKKVGEGQVTRIFNEDYSEVETLGTFAFREGTLIQVK